MIWCGNCYRTSQRRHNSSARTGRKGKMEPRETRNSCIAEISLHFCPPVRDYELRRALNIGLPATRFADPLDGRQIRSGSPERQETLVSEEYRFDSAGHERSANCAVQSSSTARPKHYEADHPEQQQCRSRNDFARWFNGSTAGDHKRDKSLVSLGLSAELSIEPYSKVVPKEESCASRSERAATTTTTSDGFAATTMTTNELTTQSSSCSVSLGTTTANESKKTGLLEITRETSALSLWIFSIPFFDPSGAVVPKEDDTRYVRK